MILKLGESNIFKVNALFDPLQKYENFSLIKEEDIFSSQIKNSSNLKIKNTLKLSLQNLADDNFFELYLNNKKINTKETLVLDPNTPPITITPHANNTKNPSIQILHKNCLPQNPFFGIEIFYHN
jgi:hypothetical protein